MPDGMPMPAAGGSPPPSTGGPPGAGAAPPMGVSPGTGPAPNKGYEAAGLQQLGVAIQLLERLIPLLGSSSQAGADVLKALNMLAKHVPTGAVTPAAQKNQVEQLALRNAQQVQQAQQMRQAGPMRGGQPGLAQGPAAGAM